MRLLGPVCAALVAVAIALLIAAALAGKDGGFRQDARDGGGDA